jgi:predicted HTH transcriptional regulator
MKWIILTILGIAVGYWLARRGKHPVSDSKVINQEGVEEKQKRLVQIIEYFNTHDQVTNNEIEQLLGVSDSAVGRYLDELEQQEKILQIGRTGRSVIYKKR